MKTRCHVARIQIAVSPERAFEAFCRPSDIRGWWGAQRAIVLARPGGLWMAAWGEDEDDPEYITSAVLRVYDPPSRLVMSDYSYFAREGQPPFEANFSTEVRCRAEGGGTLVRVTQDGFPAGPEADAFYAACEKGWHDSLHSLKRFLESETRP